MPSINIQGTLIDFPDTGNSPVWSDAVIQFAQAVEAALATITGPFDVAPQIYNMESNLNINVTIPSLQFPTSDVRGAFVRYTVSRSTSTASAYEGGQIMVDYNPDNPIGNKWEIAREYAGDGSITFTITDVGQIQFTTVALGGINHSGQIAFTAQSLTNS